MKSFLTQAWKRFRNEVPATERKLQLILAGAATTFGSMSAINWPGGLAVAGTLCGYTAAACGGMTFLLQFAINTEQIVDGQTALTKTED